MINLITETISKLSISPAFTVFYGLKSLQNLEDDATFPIILVDPLLFSFDIKNRVRRYRVSMFFADKSDYDFTYDQHNNIHESLESSVIEFINRLQNDNNDYFKNIRIESGDIAPVINALDSNLTGLSVQFTMTCVKNSPIPPC